MNEAGRRRGYFIDGSQKRGLICLRRFVKAGDFSHELERGIVNLFGRDGRIKVEKRFDVPAHFHDLNKTRLGSVLPF
jgi:hypothetical protein